MDDFSNDASTNGLYTVRDKPILGINEEASDVDWIRVEGLKTWHFYNFWFYSEEVRPTYAPLKLVDGSGEVIETITLGFPVRAEYLHLHFGNEPLFLVAAGTGGDYKIFIREEDDAPNTIGEATNFRLEDRAFHTCAIQFGDIDYVKFKLREGIQYTFDLLGADSPDRQTTLSNPLLRVFHPTLGLVAADNNSGDGNNARIGFTPEQTDEYIFQIVGLKSTGSYVLESNQFDDFGADVNSTGFMANNGTPTSGRSDFDDDNDWFRISLVEHYTYKFDVNRLSDGFASVLLYDDAGDLEYFTRAPLGLTGQFLEVKPGESRDLFVQVTSDVDYEVSAKPFDVIGSDQDSFLEVNFTIDSAAGAIEEAGDRDWFRKQLAAYGLYRVDAVPLAGQPVGTFEITPRSIDNQTVFDTINGGGIYRPQEETTFFDVGASDGITTGPYRLQFTRLDAASDDENTQWNVQMVNGKGRIRNALETFDDVDWHRIQLEANKWYEIDVLTGNTQLEIRKPDGTIVPTGFLRKKYYRPDQEGEHYLIAKSEFASSIEIHIESDAKQDVESQRLFHDASGFSGGGSLLGSVEAGQPIQIYSDLTYRYTDDQGAAVDLEPFKVHTVTERFNRLRLKQRQFVGTAEVFTRVAMDENSWSTWASGEITAMGPSFELTDEGNVDISERRVRYAFADTAPEYLSTPEFSSTLSDFSPLTEAQVSAVNDAAAKWSDGLFGALKFELVSDASDADMLIYNIRFDDDDIHAAGGKRTNAIGRDLLLNSSSSVFESDASLSTDRSTFEILRGLGQTLGLSTSEDLSRLRSVMGNRDSVGGIGLDVPWPTEPLPEDLAVFRPTNFFHTKDPEKNVYWLGSVQDKPFFRTIIDSAISDSGRNIVSAFGSLLPASIDLRGGQISYVQNETSRLYSYANSSHSLISDGYGGDSDDVLIGNFLNNKLIGGKGDDFLNGGIGSDSLFGGEGNDRYGFKPGYESAFINEQSKGGVDTLEIEGRFNLDSLQDDLTFRRLGNTLVIRLDWDSQLDANTDEIKIFNMADPLSQVESLVLSTDEGEFAKVDLNSVFTQADGTRRRFQVLAESSEFGSLAAPV